MKRNFKRCIAMATLVLLLLTFVPAPLTAYAANAFYGDYTDVSYIYDYGSCPSMQGLAVGSQKLYTIKIDGSDYYSFISMTDKDSGATTKLYNADAGSYYFTYLSHANDMDVWGIDGYSNLFVTSTEFGNGAIVRLKRDGNNLTKVASYSLTCEGESICATALTIKGVSNGMITFITKWGMDLYTGSVSTSASSANIEMRKFCSITKSRVYIKGEYLDLSSFVNQGMGYHDGTLFVPISGDDSWLNRSVIMVFDLNNIVEGTTVYPTEALVFRITSSAYSALMEIESCDICSGDGKLYFNANRRVTNSNTNHDAVSCFDDYVYERLPVDAPTSKPITTSYTVRYDANGGVGTMDDTVVDYGITSYLRTNTFTRNGYDFAGWHAYRTTQNQWYYTNGTNSGWYAEGSQPSGYYLSTYSDGTGVAKTTAVDDDVVIMYAQWTPKAQTYTVRYDANGGTGTMEDTEVVYGYDTSLRKNTFTREGYKFLGWHAYRTTKGQWFYTNGTDSGWYAAGSEPSGYTRALYHDGVSVAATTSVANDVCIFYAQWERVGYTVTFKDEDGTVLSSDVYESGATVTVPAAPAKPYDSSRHYSFKGWDKTVVPATADATYTATYTATAHSYSSKVTQAATCNSTGIMTYTCSCGHSYTQSIPTTSHSYSAVVTPPTCTAAGYTTYTCSICGDSYQGDTVASGGHRYTTTTTDATCTVDGKIVTTCSKCGVTHTETIAATGHSYKSKITAPTCTASGYTTYTCSTCGHSYQADTTVPTGHSYRSTVVAPTCTAAGYTKHACTKCSYSYNDTTVAATGHSYANGCCTVCGAADPNYSPIVAPTLALKYPTVSFEDVIVMNVYYTAENLGDVAEMGLITYSSNVSVWNVNNAEEVIPGYSYAADKQMYVSSTKGIAAKNLGDTMYFAVYAKLTDGTYTYTKLVSYSPEAYAYSQLSTGAADIKPLVVAMLKYGAAAQVFFNHNTGSLVDRNLTFAQLSMIESYRADMMSAVASPSEAKQGVFVKNGGYANRYPTISFEGAFSINYYCTPSYAPASGITMYYWDQAAYDAADVLTAANATGIIKMDGTGTGRYEAAVEGIAAKDLDKGIYVAFVYRNGTTTWTSGVLAYSIGAYCTSNAAGTADVAALAAATAVYGYHAKQTFYKEV